MKLIPELNFFAYFYVIITWNATYGLK